MPVGEAHAVCDREHRERFGTPYPIAEFDDGTVFGCFIQWWGGGNPVIVYSYDVPELTYDVRRHMWELYAELLRHEIGHHLGWPGHIPPCAIGLPTEMQSPMPLQR